MASEDDRGDEDLPVLFAKQLNFSIDVDQTAYCDKYDLLAVINLASSEVTVYRAINGQVAFTAKYPDQYEESKPRLVSWKSDGTLLGVGWEDGTCCLYNSEDGKLVSRVSTLAEAQDAEWQLDLATSTTLPVDDDAIEQHPPKCLAWTRHQRPLARVRLSSRPLETSIAGQSTEDWFDVTNTERDADLGTSASVKRHGIQNLVDSITTLDVATVLPTLSALPAHGLRSGPEAAKFANQSTLNNAFMPSVSGSDGIDVLLVSGSSHTYIYLDDTVKIGSIALELQDAIHTSHPQCTSQAVLSRAEGNGSSRLTFIDLPLDTLGGSLLHVIASNTKRLQSLMTYITQTVRCIQHDYTSGQQLPTRILHGFTEELREKDDGSPTTVLFELLMTTRFTPTVVEWLTDVIKDSMRKRWEQSVLDLYDHIQNHIFVHLLPALNRLSVVASTLRGYAELYEGTSTFDVPASLLADLEDFTDALRLAAERAQLIVIAEQRQFKAFIKWLRVMVDIASAGPASKSAVETEQREIPNIDFSLSGAYIKHTMNKSKLAPYIEQLPGMKGGLDKDVFFDHHIVKEMKRENTVEIIRKLNKTSANNAGSGQESLLEAEPSINLPALAARLAAQARLCTDKITAWQQRMLSRQVGLGRASAELQIEPQATLLDMKMFPSATRQDSNACTTDILLHPTDVGCLELISVTRSRSSIDERRNTLLFDKAVVLHAQIVDRHSCFVLLKASAESSAHSAIDLVSCQSDAQVADQPVEWSKRVVHRFSATSHVEFTPKRFLVGGRLNKRVVIVLGEDDRSWQVLDLEVGNVRKTKKEDEVLTGRSINDDMTF